MKVETIGVKLIKGESITKEEIDFLKRNYQYTGAKKMTEDEILATDPKLLTLGQRRYRQSLLNWGRESTF